MEEKSFSWIEILEWRVCFREKLIGSILNQKSLTLLHEEALMKRERGHLRHYQLASVEPKKLSLYSFADKEISTLRTSMKLQPKPLFQIQCVQWTVCSFIKMLNKRFQWTLCWQTLLMMMDNRWRMLQNHLAENYVNSVKRRSINKNQKPMILRVRGALLLNLERLSGGEALLRPAVDSTVSSK